MKVNILSLFLLFCSIGVIGVFVMMNGFKFCSLDSSCSTSSTLYRVDFQTSDGEIPLYVEIADSNEERERGLMNREQLGDQSGMMFIFPYENKWGFWMKNTKISLDMIFVSKDKEVVYIYEDAEPCVTQNCESIVPEKEALYIIEANGGWADRNNVKVGDKLILPIIIKD